MMMLMLMLMTTGERYMVEEHDGEETVLKTMGVSIFVPFRSRVYVMLNCVNSFPSVYNKAELLAFKFSFIYCPV